MINVTLCLDKKSNALQIVQDLLANKLIACATVSLRRESYCINDNVFSKEINDFIICQTQSVLFSEMEAFILKYCGNENQLFSH